MQEQLVKDFKKIKKLIKPYQKYLTAKFDLDSKYDLWSIKDLEISGRKSGDCGGDSDSRLTRFSRGTGKV